MSKTDVFTNILEDNFRKLADNDPDMEVIYTNANNNNFTQNAQIDDFIEKKVDLILVVPVDYTGLSSMITRANRNNIPVICFVIKAEGGKSVYVGSESYDAGELQGDFMRKNLPENAKVLYLGGSPGLYHTAERKNGFKEACLDKRPDITLLDSQTGNYEFEKANIITVDWIQAFPEFDAIVAANDQMALGALQALKDADRLEGVMISGIDGVKEALIAIKNGEIMQSVLQNATAQAEAVFKTIKSILIEEGETPEQVTVPFESITAENIDKYYYK